MSLVGPRPEMLSLIDRYSDEHLTARRAFKPGLTGLWQLGPDASRMIYEVPEYDLHYASNWSLRLDVWILVLTALQPLRSATPRLFSWVERRTFALGRAEAR
jgi:lipopolysaccharide/colanic/teichoic acid biosynthesis glycosyltransferase